MISKPSDHPKLQNNKIGILLVNLGTPMNTDVKSIRLYLHLHIYIYSYICFILILLLTQYN